MKVLSTALLFLIMGALIQPALFAQTDDESESDDESDVAGESILSVFRKGGLWGLGFQVSFLSGTGVGVRYKPSGRTCFQAAGGAITVGDDLYYSAGAEYQFDFDVMRKSRFYGLVGFGYYSLDRNDKGELRLTSPFRLGAGVGYEMAISRKMVFSLQLPFIYYVRDKSFYPLPAAGVYYYFN